MLNPMQQGHFLIKKMLEYNNNNNIISIDSDRPLLVIFKLYSQKRFMIKFCSTTRYYTQNVSFSRKIRAWLEPLEYMRLKRKRTWQHEFIYISRSIRRPQLRKWHVFERNRAASAASFGFTLISFVEATRSKVKAQQCSFQDSPVSRKATQETTSRLEGAGRNHMVEVKTTRHSRPPQ